MEVSINYLSIILAGIASMAIGFAWYSNLMFAKPWMKEMKYTQESIKSDQASMGKMYALSFVLSLVTAYVLTHVMAMSTNFYHYSALSTGLSSAFWMWLGFIAPVQMTDVMFGKKTWTLFLINTGYQLATVLAMGLIIALMS